MIVYDFDKTIYNRDSSYDFYKFLLFRKPIILLKIPSIILSFFLVRLKKIDQDKYKEIRFSFVKFFTDKEMQNYVKEYWDTHMKNFFTYYLKQKKSTDVIISASPRFLLQYVIDKLGIKNLICTEIEVGSGKLLSKNCYGAEKVNRYRKVYRDQEIEEFYSDSYSDTPLAKISKVAFIVDKYGNRHPWDFNR